MKDIKHYFVDTAKLGDAAVINMVDKMGQEPNNSVRAKRNRVKIKISRRSSDERVCNIIDTSIDMIDKTPSPFTRLNNLEKSQRNETPTRSGSKVPLPSARTKGNKQKIAVDPEVLVEVDLNHGSTQSTRLLDPKGKKSGSSLNVESTKQEPKPSKARKNANEGNRKTLESNIKSVPRNATDSQFQSTDQIVCVHGQTGESRNMNIINVINLSDDDDSNDEGNSRSNESNAFQILMNRSKPTQISSPIKAPTQDILLTSAKKEECKEKLKNSREKLITLANKKGYSKRKLTELEDGEKIEKEIENRVKFLTGEGRKNVEDFIIPQNSFNIKQNNSNLLNYFSKTSLELPEKDSVNVSTFIVEAEVHASVDYNGQGAKKNPKNKMTYSSRKNGSSDVEALELNHNKMTESNNSNQAEIDNKVDTHRKSKKPRWSLRIKPPGDTPCILTNDESSEEEIFCQRIKSRRNTQKNIRTELPTQNTSNKVQVNRESRQSKINKKPKDQTSDTAVQSQGNSTNFKNINRSINSVSQNISISSNAKIDSDTTNKLETAKNLCGIEIIMTASEIGLKRKSTEKLAPLFTKRRKPDPEILAARRLFLQPDAIDLESKTHEQRKANIPSILPFPKISHIRQSSNSMCIEPTAVNIRMKTKPSTIPHLNVHDFKCIMDFNEPKKKFFEPTKLLTKQNIEKVLCELSEHCPDAPNMWRAISLISKEQLNKPRTSPKTKSKRNRLSDKNESKSGEQIDGASRQNILWIDKYRPKTTAEVVGNEEAAMKLKDWLNGWRATLSGDDGNSSDEFYTSDCSRSNDNENNQVAVLLGPHGSGKSASVYAVAEEMGYIVLEVNASSRRTGKKLLKELEEATRSHRIKKETGTAIFETRATEIKKKLPQNSLVLLEDVDIVFEEDEGFISAAYQLASNTKRPIVMTCRNVCPHLNRMAPQQNRIYFQTPTGERVQTLLELISLAESSRRLPNHCIADLLQKGDLRRALLQLQYLLLSGPPSLIRQNVNIRESVWQDLRYYVYKPAIKWNKKRKTKNHDSNEPKYDKTTEILNTLAKQLDHVALMSSLVDINDSAIDTSREILQPSLSLIEDHSSYCISNNISSDIADWIGSKIFRQEQSSDNDEIQYRNSIVLRNKLNKGVNIALSHVTPFTLHDRATVVDYLPAIRGICRTEEQRSGKNNKRGNRFFHYLHGLKVPSTSIRPNILAAACRIMQDRETRSVTLDKA